MSFCLMGLVSHYFEEDLEFGEFAFVSEEEGLGLSGQVIQPDFNFS